MKSAPLRLPSLQPHTFSSSVPLLGCKYFSTLIASASLSLQHNSALITSLNQSLLQRSSDRKPTANSTVTTLFPAYTWLHTCPLHIKRREHGPRHLYQILGLGNYHSRGHLPVVLGRACRCQGGHCLWQGKPGFTRRHPLETDLELI